MTVRKLDGYTLVRMNAPGYGDDGTQYVTFTRELVQVNGQRINGIEGTWISHHDVYADEDPRPVDPKALKRQEAKIRARVREQRAAVDLREEEHP